MGNDMMVSREEAEKYIIEEKKEWEDKLKDEMSFELCLGFLILEERFKHNYVKKNYDYLYKKYITEELERIKNVWYQGMYKLDLTEIETDTNIDMEEK